jgi:hypothetical protein
MIDSSLLIHLALISFHEVTRELCLADFDLILFDTSMNTLKGEDKKSKREEFV